MRRALIIGCRHGASEKEELKFAPGLAEELAGALAASGESGWTLHGDAALIDPDVAQLRAAVKAAIAAASTAKETLLIAYVGHGLSYTLPDSDSTYPDFYLQVKGSPAQPEPDDGFNLGSSLRSALRKHTSVDGVMLVIDACQAGGVGPEAVANWRSMTGGRLEVLVASNHSKAYGGCFTGQVIRCLREGLPGRGDNLYPADLLSPINTECTDQRAGHLSFNSGSKNAADQFDEGLWLLPNPAARPHALHLRPDAGLLDQVTRDVTLSVAQQEVLGQVKDAAGDRVRWMQAPAGAGKSTLMANLVRPASGEPTVVRAAAFLDSTSTRDGVCRELASQLSSETTGVPGFKQAHAEAAATAAATPGVVDVVEVELFTPLAAACRQQPALRVTVVLDGFDQLDPARAGGFEQLLSDLATREDLKHLRILVGARTAPPESIPAAAVRLIHLEAPSWGDVRAHLDVLDPHLLEQLPTLPTEGPVDGGWLNGRLIAALRHTTPRTGAGGVDPDEQYTPVELGRQAVGAAPSSLGLGSVGGGPEGLDGSLRMVARRYAAQVLTRLDEAQHDLVLDLLTLLSVTGTGPVLPLTVLHHALMKAGYEVDVPLLRTVLAALVPLVQRGRAGYDDEHVGFAHEEIRQAFYPAEGSSS